MKGKLLGPPAFAAVFLLLVSAPIFAHHGAASYDIKKLTDVKGTVVGFRFMNPHSEIDFDVNDSAGKPQKWTAEGVSATSMSRDGWSRSVLKPGDQITVTGNLAKNGAHVIRLKKVLLPSGKELSIESAEDYAQ